MPKKKKGSKKTSSSSSPEEDEHEAKRKALIKRAQQLKNDIENETKTKRDFETKLEQLKFYWDVEKKEFQKKKKEYEQRISDEEDIKKRHECRFHLMKEEMKHTLYRQQNDLIERKNETKAELYKVQGQYSVDKRKMEHRTMNCQYQLRSMQLSHNNFLAQLRSDHDEKVRRLQKEFKLKFHEITNDSERKVKEIKEEVEDQMNHDLKALEEKKERQVQEMVCKHEEVRNALSGNPKLDYFLNVYASMFTSPITPVL